MCGLYYPSTVVWFIYRYFISEQTIVDGEASFTIDEGTGTVRTRGSFDRESFSGPYSVIVSG